MTVSVEKLTSVYLKIRNKRSELKAAFDEEYNRLGDQMDKVKDALLTYCRENDLDSFKTKDGTVSRTVQKKYWTDDWEAMHRFIVEERVPEFLTKQLNQGNVKQYLEENPDKLPPGLNSKSEYNISVRKRQG